MAFLKTAIALAMLFAVVYAGAGGNDIRSVYTAEEVAAHDSGCGNSGVYTGLGELKVDICHGTASDSNPYVLISVPLATAVDHLNGDGSSDRNQRRPDMFPNSIGYDGQLYDCDCNAPGYSDPLTVSLTLPAVNAAGSTYSGDEDTAVAISGSAVASDAAATVTVYIELEADSGCSVSGGSPSGSAGLVWYGSADDFSSGAFSFSCAQDQYGCTTVSIVAEAVLGSEVAADSAIVSACLESVNDAPYVSTSGSTIDADWGSYTCLSDVSGVLSAGDVDADSVTVTVTADNGFLVSSSGDLTVVGTDRMVSSSMAPADVQAYVNSLCYISDEAFFGFDTIVVSVNDNGSSGKQPAQTNFGSVSERSACDDHRNCAYAFIGIETSCNRAGADDIYSTSGGGGGNGNGGGNGGSSQAWSDFADQFSSWSSMTICHGTGSGYTQIAPSVSSVNGHFSHHADSTEEECVAAVAAGDNNAILANCAPHGQNSYPDIFAGFDGQLKGAEASVNCKCEFVTDTYRWVNGVRVSSSRYGAQPAVSGAGAIINPNGDSEDQENAAKTGSGASAAAAGVSIVVVVIVGVVAAVVGYKVHERKAAAVSGASSNALVDAELGHVGTLEPDEVADNGSLSFSIGGAPEADEVLVRNLSRAMSHN